mmetsp:Transcript_36853/g.66614  ORF Transcript_36853/g.66614 Transcript_36853/m.66614 type:complete len:363 (+) Transcript_36853:390-1478(+)
MGSLVNCCYCCLCFCSSFGGCFLCCLCCRTGLSGLFHCLASCSSVSGLSLSLQGFRSSFDGLLLCCGLSGSLSGFCCRLLLLGGMGGLLSCFRFFQGFGGLFLGNLGFLCGFFGFLGYFCGGLFFGRFACCVHVCCGLQLFLGLLSGLECFLLCHLGPFSSFAGFLIRLGICDCLGGFVRFLSFRDFCGGLLRLLSFCGCILGFLFCFLGFRFSLGCFLLLQLRAILVGSLFRSLGCCFGCCGLSFRFRGFRRSLGSLRHHRAFLSSADGFLLLRLSPSGSLGRRLRYLCFCSGLCGCVYCCLDFRHSFGSLFCICFVVMMSRLVGRVCRSLGRIRMGRFLSRLSVRSSFVSLLFRDLGIKG